MSILVTGGAGYIGSHTVKALKESNLNPIVLDNLVCGHEKIVTERLKVPFIEGEVGDQKLINNLLNGENSFTKESPIEGIIHFAAYAYVGESVINPLKYYKNNVRASLDFLDSIVNYNLNNMKSLPIVFSSTCATYGYPQNLPITEENIQEPINPYGWSKFFVERLLKDFGKSYGLKSVIFRYFNAAGADPQSDIGEDHNPETHLTPLIFDVISGKKEILEIFGDDYPTKDGTCIRDYIHVNDLADAHIKGLNFLFNKKNLESKFSPEIFNLGNGKGYSVKEVIEKAELVIGKKLNYKISKRREGDPPVLISSSKKSEDILNWEPKYKKIEIIIDHAWKWYCKNNSNKKEK